jgi:predicted negative regulator of RcsB-dependent stress response
LPLTVPKSARLRDPGAELLDRATVFWDRKGRIVLGVVGGVVAVAAIGLITMRTRAATEGEAAGKLAEANVLYWQGEYERSLAAARQIAQQFPSAPSGIEAHRLAGDNAYWNGDPKTAVSEYRAYLDRQKQGVLADAARRSLAYALESNKQYQDAANTYESLIGKFDRESSAEFLAAAARCYRALGRPAEATRRLQRLVDEFGETSYANLARIQLAEYSTAPH